MVRLNRSARADIEWWRMFARSWNGINFLPFARAQITLTSDASGSWGCGAFYEARWFQFQWSDLLRPQNIAAMELLPILLASAMWGSNWQAHHILCQCDNQAVVAVLNKGSAKDLMLAHILRCISFYAAHYGFSFSAIHVPGEHNRAADALSRNNVQLFLSIFPQAQPVLDSIPPKVVQMSQDRLGLDRAKLESSLHGYFVKGVARSTASVYKSAQTKYLAFSSRFFYQPLPLSEPVVCSFAAFLADSGLTFWSIKVYISGIRHWQIASGLPEPFKGQSWPKLEYVLKGIKRSQAENFHQLAKTGFQ